MKAKNLVEMLHHTVQRFPEKEVYMWKVDGVYQTMTYQTFWNKIEHVASGFSRLGINENDKVAILSNSNPMWGITDFALASLGAVSVPIYPTLPADQIAHVLKNADVRIAVVENEELSQRVNTADTVLDCQIIMYPDTDFKSDESALSFDQLELEGETHPLSRWDEQWSQIDRDQLITIIHTSGTTGKPKGVMLSHGNFMANMEAVHFWMIELVPEDVALSYLPLSHVFERMAGHYMPLSVGVTIAYAENIDTIQENLKEIRPTVLTSVPRLFEKVYSKVFEEINDGSAVKQKVFNWAVSIGEARYEQYLDTPLDQLILGESMPKQLHRKWKIADRLVFQKVKSELGGRIRGMVSGGGTLNPDIARFFWAIDLPILEGYGLTETAPVISTNPTLRAKVGTVGKILPNLEVKIASDGEVLVRGPSVMEGYYNDPAATAKDFDGNWFLTGDIGELDDDNYLKIIDRKKRIIVLSTGKNVAPQPIESAINESNYIEQSMVFGDQRKYIVCLVSPDAEFLQLWAKQNGIQSKTLEEICLHPKVKGLLEGEVDRLTGSFAKFERPKQVIIIGKEWTVEGGELTPKLSIRLKKIEEKYGELIDSVYEVDSNKQGEAVVAAENG